MPDLTSAAVSAGNAIGRAFSVVSLIPALIFVGITWTLVASGAFAGKPDPGEVIRSAQDLSFGGAVALLLCAMTLGYAIHPIQFAATQFLEGYWGSSEPAVKAMTSRAVLYRTKQRTLIVRLRRAEAGLSELGLAERRSELGDLTAVPHLLTQQQTSKALGELPVNADRVMPTRLGNVLRRHEDLIGEPYGLPGVNVVAPITLVARDESNRYLADSAEQLDTAVSVCMVSAGATVMVATATLTDGWWLLTALVPYTMCYLAYRGAVSAATGYGLAMRHLVDLDRFALYRAMNLPLPQTLAEEREMAGHVQLLLDPPGALRFSRSGKAVLAGGRTVEVLFEPDAERGHGTRALGIRPSGVRPGRARNTRS